MRWPWILLLACSQKSAPPAPTRLDQLALTVDGKPSPLDRAFLVRASPDVHTLILGNGKGSCTEPGNLGLTLTRRLAPTGHERVQVTDLYARDFDARLATPAPAELAGPKLTLHVATPKLSLEGSLEPVVCPDPTPTGLGAPKMTHRSTGTLTVARKQLAIKGVTVKARAGVAATDLPDITISTNLLDCSSVTLPAPIILAREDGKWTMRGTYLEGELAETESTLAFTANGVGKSPDGPTLELQLSGAAKLGDYAVTLAGTAEAIECVH